jgi:hypothetical protein
VHDRHARVRECHAGVYDIVKYGIQGAGWMLLQCEMSGSNCIFVSNISMQSA